MNEACDIFKEFIEYKDYNCKEKEKNLSLRVIKIRPQTDPAKPINPDFIPEKIIPKPLQPLKAIKYERAKQSDDRRIQAYNNRGFELIKSRE